MVRLATLVPLGMRAPAKHLAEPLGHTHEGVIATNECQQTAERVGVEKTRALSRLSHAPFVLRVRMVLYDYTVVRNEPVKVRGASLRTLRHTTAWEAGAQKKSLLNLLARETNPGKVKTE